MGLLVSNALVGLHPGIEKQSLDGAADKGHPVQHNNWGSEGAKVHRTSESDRRVATEYESESEDDAQASDCQRTYAGDPRVKILNGENRAEACKQAQGSSNRQNETKAESQVDAVPCRIAEAKRQDWQSRNQGEKRPHNAKYWSKPLRVSHNESSVRLA
jgi:hypothetical protein